MTASARLSLAFAAILAAAPAPEAAGILLINGNSNNTVPRGGLSLGDAFLKQRLETVSGHRTTVMEDAAAAVAMRAAADSADMVLVLESVTSALLLAKLKGTPTPILNCEAFIQDDLGLTATGPSGDPGPPSRFEFGVLDGQTSLDVAAGGHPLAAGLGGRVAVYTAAKQVNWGKVAATAQVVATLAGDAAGASIYVYAKGARLFDGGTAAGLRIGFFLEDDNETGSPNLMTPDGLKLFDAAVAYALDTGKPSALLRASPARGGRGGLGCCGRIGIPGVDALGRAGPAKTGPIKAPRRLQSSKS